MNELKLQWTESGVYCGVVDEVRAIAMRTTLSKDKFDTYRLDSKGEVITGVNAGRIVSKLDVIELDELLTIEFDESKLEYINFKAGAMTYNSRLVAPITLVYTLDALNPFTNEKIVSALKAVGKTDSSIKKILIGAAKVSDTIELGIDKEGKLQVKTKGKHEHSMKEKSKAGKVFVKSKVTLESDFSSIIRAPKEELGSKSMDLSQISKKISELEQQVMGTGVEAKCMYSLRYLTYAINAAKVDDVITIRFNNSMPCMVSYDVYDYMIAPIKVGV